MPYPATVSHSGPVDANASVAFRGAPYSVPPGFVGSVLTVRHRLGSPTVEIVSATGALVAVHRRATGGLVRLPDHRAALEAAVLGSFSTARPCVPKGHHPPGPAARAAAAALRGPEARRVRVDLAWYAELVEAAR